VKSALQRTILPLLPLLLLATGCATVWQGLTPQGPPPGSESARRLLAGPWQVDRRDFRFVDDSRSTPANRDFPGAACRALPTSVWSPREARGPRPLVIYSHGFLSQRREAAYLVEHLASHGYVVASADFPLSHRGAPGGATLRDAANQPGDVSFVIDSLLALSSAPDALAARVDPERIGNVGLSLGGLTTLRDARVRAAVSIAGPSAFFSRRFFETAPVPFLMIASPEDAIVDYAAHAAVIPERVPTGALLSLEGASHTGFAHVSATVLRFSPNPDRIGCWYMGRRLDLDPADENPLAALGGPEAGVEFPASAPRPCQRSSLPRAMRPRRQQVITTLAVRAFLDAELGASPEVRGAAARYLARGLARDFEEVELVPSERGAS
jgi:dienelactone hydrolase